MFIHILFSVFIYLLLLTTVSLWTVGVAIRWVELSEMVRDLCWMLIIYLGYSFIRLLLLRTCRDYVFYSYYRCCDCIHRS